MQSFLPLPQSARGGFQNEIWSKYAGSVTWWPSQNPLPSRSHVLALAGEAPNHSATCFCTSGLSVQFSHMYMQFGCLAWLDIIHVSAQPVAPSAGSTASTGCLSACSVLTW